MLDRAKQEVKILMDGENSGHGLDHILRVFDIAMKISEDNKSADREIISLAALLHDCDDYKVFGCECAENLTNAKKIMDKINVDEHKQEIVCEIVKNMGYSKLLKGIRPTTIEGKIVSDADMLDAIGANGIVRCLAYSLAKNNGQVFDKDTFPEIEITAENYIKSGRKTDKFVNHFFEKLLKLKGLMLTEEGKKEAEKRHDVMVTFLERFFEEQGLNDWNRFLNDFLKTI